MARTFANEIVETSQTVGTGTYDLDGAKGSYRAFRQGYSDADTPSYWVRNAGNTKWEMNRGGALTYGTPDRLARNVVLSTNGNAAVSWTSSDLPLTVYVPRDADVDEGVVTGFLAATRSALLRAGARWWDSTAGLAVSWIDNLYSGSADIRVGLFDAVKELYFPDNRRASTAIGAANRVFAAADIGGSFTFSTSAAARTATLPAGSTVKDGYHLEMKGLSTANGIVLTPAAGDGIDGGADAATKTIPGGVLFTVRWSNADDMWITNYRAASAAVYPTGTITGLTYGNSVSDATNDIDIAAGACMDATGALWMVLAALTKRLDAAWAVGTNQGGLDTGSIADADYYIWAIARSDTGVTDILFSLSATAPTMPTNYDYKRLIGWFKRASSAIVAFTTWESAGGGLALRWTAPTLDVNVSNTLTTSELLSAVKVPLNFSVEALVTVAAIDASSEFMIRIYRPGETSAAPSATAAPLANLYRNSGGTSVVGEFRVRTDATGRIAARSNFATIDTYNVQTVGFDWSRR